MLYLTRAGGRNKFGERLAPDAGEGEINNVGIAKEVVEKWLDRFQRVGSTELKENYPQAPYFARHLPPQQPWNGGTLLPTRCASQWRSCKRFVAWGSLDCKICSGPCKLVRELSFAYARIARYIGLYGRAGVAHHRPDAGAGSRGQSFSAADGSASARERGRTRGAKAAARRQAHRAWTGRRSLARSAPDDCRPPALA